MKIHDGHREAPITKDAENEVQIPADWRPVLAHIVDAFVRHDYRLSIGVPGVAPVSPKESWNTSVCIWMEDRWDALIDLWTAEKAAVISYCRFIYHKVSAMRYLPTAATGESGPSRRTQMLFN